MTGSWKLCPLGQTEEMYDAISATGKLWRDMNSEKVWRVQAKAAPTPPDEVLERMATAFVETWQPRLGLMDEEMHEAVKAMRAALAAAGSET